MADFALGVAQGLDQGYRRYRADQMLDEDRKADKDERAYQRSRQMAADARAEEQYQYDVNQRGTRERAAQISLDSAQEGLDATRQTRKWTEEDRPLQLADAKAERERRAAGEKREQSRFDMSSKQFQMTLEEAQRQMKDEGFEDLLDALERGANPDYAFQKFNAKGKIGIRPGTGKYDPATRTISGVDSEGKPFTGTIDQLRALLPPKPAGKLDKLGEGDRLIRTNKDGTTTDVTPAPAPGAGRAGAGQYRNKFNWQTHIGNAEDQVWKVMGGKFNTLTERYDPPEGGGAKVSLAQAFVGDLGRRLEEQGIPIEPGELGNIAGSIVRDNVVTFGEAEEKLRADPKWKNAGEEAIRTQAQSMVKSSQVRARQLLEAEFKDLVRTSQQRDLENQDLAGGKTSPDIADDQTQNGTPDPKLLRPGKGYMRKDGTIWTLIDGRPTQVDRTGKPIGAPGGATANW